MTLRYSPQDFEPGWRAQWDAQGLHRTPGPSDRPTFYCLDFFPYPSGEGLGVGHLRNYVPSDVISRYMRMRGYDVLHPMGWDAFGLPTENDAIARGRNPIDLTAEYTANYKRQLQLSGLSFDWDREINSSLPDYYRWTQWIFLLLYQRGLAYRSSGWQWWCSTCGALANEEVNADGTDWRGHANITKKRLTQWFFKITDYADELIADLEEMDWPQRTKRMQVNWIGRSEGANVTFKTEQGDELPVFTTRADTLFGATFMVLAPEHPLVEKATTVENRVEVDAYVAAASRASDIDRTALDREKTGVFTGGYAINPINGERLPIWIADYVLMTYGSGAIMAVPAHDERDFEFARKHGLEIRTVIAPPDWDGHALEAAYLGEGEMVNSGEFSGMPSAEGMRAVTQRLADRSDGDFAVNYRLRDWLISRQRYWGTPIPIVYCDACGEAPVPVDQLPVLLPPVDEFNPEKLGGRSPLEAATDWVNTTCPSCGAPARRETDTLGGFACSSWYFLRFCSPQAHERAFDSAAVRRWMPVDLYVGGSEHTVMHLLYARFWTKVLCDAGELDFGEPFRKLRHQGMLLAQPGWVETARLETDSEGVAVVADVNGAPAFDSPTAEQPYRVYPHEARFELTGARERRGDSEMAEFRATKMSKSWKNVVTPDEVVAKTGADALRCYIMFMGPIERTLAWSEQGLAGVSRWLGRLSNLVLDQPIGATERSADLSGDVESETRRRLHKTIRKVSEDIEALKFNTMIAALMEFTNYLIEVRGRLDRTSAVWREAIDTLLVLLAPSACFSAEELWHRTGHSGSVHAQPWPEWDERLAADETFTLVVQVNGKVRDRLEAPVGLDEQSARALAMASPRVQSHLNGRPPRRVIFRPRRLINLVAG